MLYISPVILKYLDILSYAHIRVLCEIEAVDGKQFSMSKSKIKSDILMYQLTVKHQT